jgi:hypothetical protein
MIDLNAIISSSLAENTHVWVVLKGNNFLNLRGSRGNGLRWQIIIVRQETNDCNK